MELNIESILEKKEENLSSFNGEALQPKGSEEKRKR
jgi:hypothetical protein